MKVVLVAPQIPQNAGNIVRTCAVTGSALTMVRPLGFSTSDRWLKRSGLDYWEGVEVDIIDDLAHLLEGTEQPFYFFSSKATKLHTEVKYTKDSLLIFGSETSGLPAWVHEKWPDRLVKIPMIADVRCLNLSVSVGIGVYEAWRQQQFL